MLTHDEIIKLAIRGTTSKPTDLKVFYVDERFAIVKHNGSSIYYSTGSEWVPAWIEVYFIDLLQEKGSGAGVGRTINTGKKRLTEKILPELLEKAEQLYAAKLLRDQKEEEEADYEEIEEEELIEDDSFSLSDMEALNKLYHLANIPWNDGEQSIEVSLNLNSFLSSGEIRYNFNYKQEMGTIVFHNLDDAMQKIKGLIEKYKPTMEHTT